MNEITELTTKKPPLENASGLGLLVCHDTGAANAVAALAKSWLKAGTPASTFCTGPAIKTFEAHGLKPWGQAAEVIDPQEAAAVLAELEPDFVLTGTSYDAWTERLFCQEARKLGVWSVGLVEWWSGFCLRFSTPRTKDLNFVPDLVAVLDEECRAGCLAEGLPPERLIVTGNPFWDELVRFDPERLEVMGLETRKRLGLGGRCLIVLVASTIIRNLDRRLGFDEEDFWAAVSPLPFETSGGRPIKWLVKPHPQEDPVELNDILARHQVDPLLVDGLSALEALAAAQVVVGTLSSMLMEAALLGRSVFSIQPGRKPGVFSRLKVFKSINLPVLTDQAGVDWFLDGLIAGRLDRPDLKRLPWPLTDGNSGQRLLACCSTGGQHVPKQAQRSSL
ncbi:MAG: hypothetical protein JRJ59_08405 [Deltaproteobacteria bacterium]|nr:hypothetical protein [Deltaproteobacteria bacterium]